MIYLIIALFVLGGITLVVIGSLDPIIRTKDNKFSRWWKRNIVDEDPYDK